MTWDGKPWWIQPWWRKLLWAIGLIGLTVGLTIWWFTRKATVAKALGTGALGLPPELTGAADASAEERARIEKERADAEAAAIKAIWEKTTAETITAFHKRFGRPS